MDFGSLSEPCKGGPDGEYPCQRGCQRLPNLAEKTNYFFFAYTGFIFLWVGLRAPGLFHWGKVELPTRTGFVIFSAFSMTFYVGSFSMLFGKLFGENRQDTMSSDATQKTA